MEATSEHVPINPVIPPCSFCGASSVTVGTHLPPYKAAICAECAQAVIEQIRESKMENHISSEHAPINPAVGRHDFVPSEFSPQSGRCDTCGGTADAEIHQKPVDQVERIADALESIDVTLEVIWSTGRLERITDALEQIAGHLSAITNLTSAGVGFARQSRNG